VDGGYTSAVLAADHQTGAAWIDRALALNPNSAWAWNVRGWVAVLAGDREAPAGFFKQAMRLSPLDPMGWSFTGGMVFTALLARRFDDALIWAERRLHE